MLQASGAAPEQGSLLLLAARLLAAPIERIARADARLERVLAAGLHAVAAQPAAAGSPAPAGPVGPRRIEALARAVGLDEAALRGLIRFDRTLAALPRITEAYDRGALSRAKLVALLGMATPDTEAIWLDRADRYDPIALGAAATVAAATVAAGPVSAGSVSAGSGSTGPTFAGPMRVQLSVAAWSGRGGQPGPDVFHGATPSAAAPRVQRSVVARPGSRDLPEPDVFPVWMDVTTVVREALRPLGHGTDPAVLALLEIDAAPERTTVASERAWAGPMRAPAGRSRVPADRARTPSLFDDLELPAAQRDREAGLKDLVARRQSVEWRLGRLLATMRRHALYRPLGFATLEAWAAVAAGLPPARVEALLAIDALVQSLAATEDAFRRGRVGLVQVRLIARATAGDPGHEREWLRRAVQLPVERLEAMVRAQSPGGGPGAPRGITSGVPVTGSASTATSVS